MMPNHVYIITMRRGEPACTPFVARIQHDTVWDAVQWMAEPAQAQTYRTLEVLPGNTDEDRAHANERLAFWTALES